MVDLHCTHVIDRSCYFCVIEPLISTSVDLNTLPEPLLFDHVYSGGGVRDGRDFHSITYHQMSGWLVTTGQTQLAHNST